MHNNVCNCGSVGTIRQQEKNTRWVLVCKDWPDCKPLTAIKKLSSFEPFGYINAIQLKLITQYGFKENPNGSGQPSYVPDGEYPMEIGGVIDNVRIEGGKIKCLRFNGNKSAVYEDNGVVMIKCPGCELRLSKWDILAQIQHMESHHPDIVRLWHRHAEIDSEEYASLSLLND